MALSKNLLRRFGEATVLKVPQECFSNMLFLSLTFLYLCSSTHSENVEKETSELTPHFRTMLSQYSAKCRVSNVVTSVDTNSTQYQHDMTPLQHWLTHCTTLEFP